MNFRVPLPARAFSGTLISEKVQRFLFEPQQLSQISPRVLGAQIVAILVIRHLAVEAGNFLDELNFTQLGKVAQVVAPPAPRRIAVCILQSKRCANAARARRFNGFARARAARRGAGVSFSDKGGR